MKAGKFKKVKNAFIVDDSLIDGKLLQIILKAHELAEEVTVFECPVKALEFFKEYTENEKSLIFLDINMPRLNGFQFLTRFNRLPVEKTKPFRVVIVSSSDSPYDIRKSATFNNVIGYLVKPVKPTDFQKIEL